MKATLLQIARTARFPAFVLLWVSLLAQPALSADKPSLAPIQNAFKTDAPIHIASDRVEVSQPDRILTFEGHVVVQQADLTITGRRLRIFGIPVEKEVKGKKGEQGAMVDKIDRIEVEGEVKISQQEKVAVADKAVYYHADQKIVLMGNPSVSQGQDRVQGRLITLFIAQGRSVVEGGSEGPVQAVLFPSRKE